MGSGLEDGVMEHLVSSMESLTQEEEQVELAARRLVLRKKRGTNRVYAWSSVACEALSFLNIFFQWWITNNFIGSADTSEWPELGSQVNFYTLGWMTLAADRSYLPANILFPRQIACKLSVHGLGGGRASTGSLCLLPLNIIHDKLFLALWFWLLFVSVVTGLHFTYRMVMVSNREWRKSKLDWELLKVESENERDRLLWISGVSANYPDWAVFQVFRNNCSKVVASKVVKKMYEELVKED